MNFKLIQICSDYATRAHKGQYRKDKVTPYISHPARVANYVSLFIPNNSIVISAAYLHDVLEDCQIEVISKRYNIQNELISFDKFLLSNDEIEKKDGEKIFRIVKELTCDKSLPKNERKIKYYNKLRDEGLIESCIIKFCDRIDNLQTIDCFTKKGREWYLKDTQKMINILGRKKITNIMNYDNAWISLKQEMNKNN